MRIIVTNSYREVSLNVPVEEEEGCFRAQLSQGQYARVLPLVNGALQVRRARACDFYKARISNDCLIWEEPCELR